MPTEVRSKPMTAAGGQHGMIAVDLATSLNQHVKAAGVVEGYWPGAPDLAAAVVSPHDRYTEAEGKVTAWLDGGDAVPGWSVPVRELFR